MIERTILTSIAIVVGVSVLASVLPRLLPIITVIFVLAVIGRVVWWYTR